MRLSLINGPNLNLLGKREPEIYGASDLKMIEKELKLKADQEGIEIDFFQSNSEGSMIDHIQKSIGQVNGIMINAGAYTHTSIALRDALIGSQIPYVEIHISNIYAREDFRSKSFLADKAIGLVSGFGSISYKLAMAGLLDHLRNSI